MKLSVLVPAYREEKTIQRVIHGILSVDLQELGVEREIIVCDDGSDDATFLAADAVARAHRSVLVVRHEVNRGKGRAIRTALGYATGAYVLVQDADLEYDPVDYPALLSPVLRTGAPVVYGSRFLERPYPEGMHPLNFAANKVLTWTANASFGLRLTDEATCFKLIRTDLLRGFGLTCEGFEFCPEVTAKIGIAGIPIVEVPVRYIGRSVAQGKKVGWRDGLVALSVLLKSSRVFRQIACNGGS